MSQVENPPVEPAPPQADITPGVAYAAPAAPAEVDARRVADIGRRGWIVRGAILALLLVGGFVAYELWFTGLLESRAQAGLLSQFRASLALDDSSAVVTPPDGKALGIVSFPRFGEQQVMVQGMSDADTKLGPGHDPSTPAPGQAGNAVLVGRRETYGAPFQHLGGLQTGDTIVTTTRQGQFLYAVQSVARAPLGSLSVVAPTKDDRLTLITAASGVHPSSELVVVGKLEGQGLQAPGPLPLRPAGLHPGASSGVGGSWGSLLLWGQLLLITIAAAVLLYVRRWNAAVTYLLTTPLIITFAIMFYGAIDALLPASL
ncbi:MAG TPA: sortase [Gaiellales bacterium]|nr:sortase [Gaiellales bacterium]